MRKLVFAMAVFFLVGFGQFVYAEDYIITIYKDGQAVSIEHNGKIHAFGRGEPEKDIDANIITHSFWGIPPGSLEATEAALITAQEYEKQGRWAAAAYFYRDADETEKMEEMAYKDIEDSLIYTPPLYKVAGNVALEILKDKDLTMKYYEKHINQKLNNKL